MTRPMKMAELRVRDLVLSTAPGDVAAAIAAAGGCPLAQVKTGDIRSSPVGLGTMWVRCPLVAARKVVIAKKVRVGWTTARVEALVDRPLQCFHYLDIGHVRQWCTSTINRSGRCHNCGSPEHKVAECRNSPKCPLCSDLVKPDRNPLATGCGPGCACLKKRESPGTKSGGHRP